jgi:glycosyltransferase involved in cell wall biosynthesis
LNILQIVSGRGVNGALVYCKILSEELARRGHRVTILCRPKSWMTSAVDCGLVSVVESSLSRFPWSELKRMSGMVRARRIELIHTHMTRGQNFGVALKLLTGVPVVATAHNRHFELHWNFNDYVIANSRSTFDYHSRVNRIPPHRMETIYCCPDFQQTQSVRPRAVESIRRQMRVADDDLLIGVVGEIAVRKGHQYFVQALPEIAAHLPGLKVVFVGRFGRKQPHVRKIRKFILQNGLAGRIKWVGRRSNVAEYMAACQLTVVPSIEEPLGLVAIESLLVGTPVVASNTGGLGEVVRDRESGLLVPPADPKALAEAVIALAGDASARSRMGTNGRRYAEAVFSPAHLIDRVEEVYRRIAGRSRVA